MSGRGRLRLARGTSAWLAPLGLATAATVTGARWWRPCFAAAVPLASVAGLMVWFFRDPERRLGEGRILAPADGVVQSVQEQPDGRIRVSIFMSLLDVHVNRAPCAGRVVSIEHLPGGYLPAFDKDSDRNERVVWHIAADVGKLELTQIAGALARRIVPYTVEGTELDRGERIGLIRLGSRVDVHLPVGISPSVAVRERTRAGQTSLA